MTMDFFFQDRMGSVRGSGRMSCGPGSGTVLFIRIAGKPLQILVSTPGCIPPQVQQYVWRWDPGIRDLWKLSMWFPHAAKFENQ